MSNHSHEARSGGAQPLRPSRASKRGKSLTSHRVVPSDDSVARLVTEDGFRQIERILAGDRDAPYLRAWVIELIIQYVMIGPPPPRDSQREQRKLRAVAAAFAKSRGALAALGEEAMPVVQFFSGAIFGGLNPAEQARLIEPLARGEMLTEIIAQCSRIESAALAGLGWYPRQRGRRPKHECAALFLAIAHKYRRETGKFGSVTTSAAGDKYGKGESYTGNLFDLARIILSAATAAAGEPPRPDTWLGPALKDAAKKYRARAIAEEIGVSGETVRRARKTTVIVTVEEKRIGRDGRARRRPKSRKVNS